MTGLYSVLRGFMAANDADQKYLADLIGKSLKYVSLRFRGLAEWDGGDMYTIMDEFNIPHDQLHVVFPPHGRAEASLPQSDSDGSRNRIYASVSRKSCSGIQP